jgi:hypothetical protein
MFDSESPLWTLFGNLPFFDRTQIVGCPRLNPPRPGRNQPTCCEVVTYEVVFPAFPVDCQLKCKINTTVPRESPRMSARRPA